TLNKENFHLPTAVVSGMFLSIIISMTIGGNVLVLLAVFVNSHLRSTTNIFIVNLAVADLLLGTAVLPFSASKEVINYWAFGQTFCDIWAAVDVLCCTASIMSLCVISIDRYIGVTRPLQHSTIMTEKRAIIIVLCVWIASIAICVAPLVGWKEPPDPNPLVCTVTEQLGYVIFSVSWSFYIPLIIILIVYFRIYREALKQSRFLATGIKTSKGGAKDDAAATITLRVHTGGTRGGTGGNAGARDQPYTSSSSSEHSDSSGRKYHSRLTLAGKMAKFKREKKAAQTLGIVVGVFILCWFPFFFILPLGALCPSCYIPEMAFKIFFWLGYCNSTMNPIIYACSSREFKRAFKRILRCQFRRRPRKFLDTAAEPSTSTTEICRLSVANSSRHKSSPDSERGPLRWSMKKSFSSHFPGSRRSSLEDSPILPLRQILERSSSSSRKRTGNETLKLDEDDVYNGDNSDDEKQSDSLSPSNSKHTSLSHVSTPPRSLNASNSGNFNGLCPGKTPLPGTGAAVNGRVKRGSGVINFSSHKIPDIKVHSAENCSSEARSTVDVSSEKHAGISNQLRMPRARSHYW
ncbi:alpha-1A adrenergic receptor-like, partial [Tubulanus polymorphus]|uniref:alpha-1A adrenergic receptor-like n=1 Tax=Tubulanus polymorphus TaxID=672921 RepID=UPI003DA38858